MMSLCGIVTLKWSETSQEINGILTVWQFILQGIWRGVAPWCHYVMEWQQHYAIMQWCITLKLALQVLKAVDEMRRAPYYLMMGQGHTYEGLERGGQKREGGMQLME